MPIDKTVLFSPRPTGQDGWLFDYAFALLAELAYYPDLAFDDKWGEVFGFTSTQTVVTPGVELPNFVKIISPTGCVFAIAGTTHWNQMLQNVIYSGYTEDVTLGPGKIHSFFAWVAKGLVPFIQAALTGIPAGTPISFTGHSLGGAVATLLAYWFERNTGYEVRNCVAFCSPKVGNSTWANYAHTFRYRHIYNDRDFVVNLPPGATFFIPLADTTGWSDTRIGYAAKGPEFFLVPGRFENYGAFGPIAFAGSVTDFSIRAMNEICSANGPVGLRDTQWLVDHKLRTLLDIMKANAFRLAFAADWGKLADLDELLKSTPLTEDLAPNAVQGVGIVPVANFLPPATQPATFPDPLPILANTAPPIVNANTNATVTGSGEQTTIFGRYNPPPVPDVDGTVQFPTEPRPFYVFRGKDRRMLQKLLDLMNAIEARDLAAMGDVPSSALSTREPIIEPDDGDQQAAWFAMRDVVETSLAQERAED